MQPSRRDKLKAHAEHLLDAFLGLRSTYAMLEPALFDRAVIDRWGAGRRVHGLELIRNALLHSCVLEIAKLTLDKDSRAPSIAQLVDALDDKILTELQQEFAVWHLGPKEGEDPEVAALLEKMEHREEAERRERFDRHVCELRVGWRDLSSSPALQSFRTMRDKLIAHRELWHDGERYRPLDVASLELKHGDLRLVIAQLESLVGLLTLIFRNTSFAFEGLDRQLGEASNAFWGRESDG